MSVNYRGRLNTGYLSRVTSAINGNNFSISTAWNTRTSEWETAVLKQGFFGVFRPLMCIVSQDEKQANWVHGRVEEIVQERDPMDWKDAKSILANSDEYVVASDTGFFQRMVRTTGEE